MCCLTPFHSSLRTWVLQTTVEAHTVVNSLVRKTPKFVGCNIKTHKSQDTPNSSQNLLQNALTFLQLRITYSRPAKSSLVNCSIKPTQSIIILIILLISKMVQGVLKMNSFFTLHLLSFTTHRLNLFLHLSRKNAFQYCRF